MADRTKQVTIELGEPVEFDGTTFASLTFRRLKTKDMVAMDLVKGQMRKTLAMYASMAGVPIQVIEELDADDFEAVAGETVPLMGKSARTEIDARLKEAAAEASD